VLEWDETSVKQRAAEYKAVADVEPIQWKDVCGGGKQLSKAGQSYTCSLGNFDVMDQPGSDNKIFSFSGVVPFVSSAGCNGNAFSCAGPSMITKPFAAVPGDKVKFLYKAESGGDYYEVLIEVLACLRVDSCGPTDYVRNTVLTFIRGDQMRQVEEVKYTFPTQGSYILRFHMGSYDFTGGTVLGAKLYVMPFQLESAAVSA